VTIPDCAGKVDFRWHIIRTQPNQEVKLRDLLVARQHEVRNILEVYCPTHTTVRVMREGRQKDAPLFAGYVFVLSTYQAVHDFVKKYYPAGIVLYDRRRERTDGPVVWTVPEAQMRFFRDFNENYADQVIVLERPYSDYAFNPKTNEPNETVKVLDGPLAGRIGYLARFNKNRRLVFNMESLDGRSHMAVAIPDIWNFHVMRLHNAQGDRQSLATKKERAADLLIGLIQGCGHMEETFDILSEVVEQLVRKPSLVQLCHSLCQSGRQRLGKALAGVSAGEADQILYLVRYVKECPAYMDNWRCPVLRPFLTPTAGTEPQGERDYAVLPHPGFTEIIVRQTFSEQTYYPDSREERTERVTYYAHVGIREEGGGRYIVFANWDAFLDEYFLTARSARNRLLGSGSRPAEGGQAERQLESFVNFAPSLYQVLTDALPVKALEQGLTFRTGMPADETVTMKVLAVGVENVTLRPGRPLMEHPQIEEAVRALVAVGIRICREVSTTTHLAIWRRFLRTVWLHR